MARRMRMRRKKAPKRVKRARKVKNQRRKKNRRSKKTFSRLRERQVTIYQNPGVPFDLGTIRAVGAPFKTNTFVIPMFNDDFPIVERGVEDGDRRSSEIVISSMRTRFRAMVTVNALPINGFRWYLLRINPDVYFLDGAGNIVQNVNANAQLLRTGLQPNDLSGSIVDTKQFKQNYTILKSGYNKQRNVASILAVDPVAGVPAWTTAVYGADTGKQWWDFTWTLRKTFSLRYDDITNLPSVEPMWTRRYVLYFAVDYDHQAGGINQQNYCNANPVIRLRDYDTTFNWTSKF